jgi:hypothetical protein
MSRQLSHATHGKVGLAPTVAPPSGVTPELLALHAAWPAIFASKVEVSDQCWTWTACKDKHGYGRFSMKRHRRDGEPQVWHAHRAALRLAGIEVPADRHIDHLCRNHSCVRPDHLEAVNPGTNVRRGRQANITGWCRSGKHPWTDENIMQDGGARRCRPCRDERERAYRPPAGTANKDRTHCPQGHAYTPENTKVRRGSRECRTCIRERQRKANRRTRNA